MSAPPILHTPEQLANRRSGQPHTSMFIRMLIRAAVLRRGRAAAALFAMVVAAAVATAMMNLYVDVQAKLRTEFRSYGANVIVAAKDNQALPPEALVKIQSTLGPKTQAVPFAYVVARTKDGKSVVVAGTDFARARQLNHWWNVSHWPESTPSVGSLSQATNPIRTEPQAPTESQAPEGRQIASINALVGMRASAVVAPDRKPFDLTFQGKTIQISPAGFLQTGAAEDSRIYLDQTAFLNWTELAPTTIEIAVTGTSAEIENQITQLAQLFPTADVRPIRQILEGEANVLNKTRSTLYAAATLIVITSALCVLATLIGWVFDRRRDFAIMKALGASELMVNAFFASEAAALGAIGAVLGFAIGIGVAAWIGRANFHAPVVPRFTVFPYVLLGSILIALISAIVPIGLLRRVQPALILRGE